MILMMSGAIGQDAKDFTFYELSLLAAGADPKRFHKPTREALRKHRASSKRGGRSVINISSSGDRDAFFEGLKAQFVKENSNGNV